MSTGEQSPWKEGQLRDVVSRIIGGGTPSRVESDYWGGDIPWATVKDFHDDTYALEDTLEHISSFGLKKSAASLISSGIPLICVRMAVGRTALTTVPTAINQDVKALFPKELVLPKYLLFMLAHARRHLESVAVGSTVKGISIGQLLETRIHVPPLSEQHRIIEVIETVSDTVGQCEQAIAKFKQMRAGMLQDVFGHGWHSNGQLPSGKKKISAGNSTLGWVPHTWPVRELWTIAEVNSGITLGKVVTAQNTIELPYLRVANVQDGHIDLSEVKTIRISTEDIPKYELQYGDVLMNEGGDFDKLGRGAVWLSQIEPCLHQNHVFRVRPNTRYLLPEFLALVSGSPYGKKYFLLSAKQSTNLASINSRQLKAFPVPCPPLNVQKGIIADAGALYARIRTEESYRDKLKQIKHGLMSDLLTGRIRI